MSKEPRLRATALANVYRSQGRKLSWISRKAGLSEPFTSRVIRGERTIALSKAQLMADALGAPLFLLFESTEVDDMSTREAA